MIPKIIHQTWKTSEVPPRFRAAHESWRAQHPDWRVVLWTDAMLDALAASHFPALLPLFRSYPDQIQRVDAARYMILQVEGGFYADLDVVCRRSLDGFRNHAVVLPATEPAGVSNDFMGAPAGSPFFAFALDQLGPARRRWPRWRTPRHFRILLTTGSLFLTGCVRSWRRLGGEPITILPPELYSVAGHPDALVSHIEGGTWHGWDSRALAAAYYGGKGLAAALRPRSAGRP